jgi:hypothetical protein
MMSLIGPRIGIVHPLPVGAQRLVNAVTEPTLTSGGFYASAANALTGPTVDQGSLFPEIRVPEFQDNASAAIHRFIH